MNQSLTDLLRMKQTLSVGGIDWDDRRDKYVSAVNDLYNQIEKMLAEPIAQNTVKVGRRKKGLTENYIGTYSVDDLMLLIGDEQVRFSPQGRNIAGASGRVDVLGERGEATLILQPDASGPSCKPVSRRSRSCHLTSHRSQRCSRSSCGTDRNARPAHSI